ncbi:transforming growth factor beta receptor type 3 [Genypterus blacodes]|uniref:transforming growth factor beta receptor type 3 n=1 Tax=Genypterus blacodes TaxID=154954 RepID=UPI003F763244
MMHSLSGMGWTVFRLLFLLKTTAALTEEGQCSVAIAGALHPVQGLLEKFEAGPGCAGRESGTKETHVIAVGGATHQPENKVTVLLKPLSAAPSPYRELHLLLSSRLPVHWWLEAKRLPADLPVLVQLSSNSSIESPSLRLQVQSMHSLPYQPRALHRWALKHHSSLSSLTHTSHGNQVYIHVGEDPTLPAVCQLQSVFLSHNYMTSDLQPQEVQGCTPAGFGGNSPEVHIIKLHSAGSGLCGSLQVEVTVSLVPPVATWNTQNVVLILSSMVPVNWAISAHGLQGQISVHSSNSVSPPYPPEPSLTLSTAVNSDLSTIPDLLVWAKERGYTKVTSYTEADLANRFVVQLAGGSTALVATVTPLSGRPPWVEEHRLRQRLNGEDQEALTVQCEDGQLSVALGQSILQILSVPVAAVTLQDLKCQAQSNGSHFLLVFPVMSCETEAVLLGRPRRVQYKNMVLLWRDDPQSVLALNKTGKEARPFGIHFSCVAAVPSPVDVVSHLQAELLPWSPKGPELNPGPRHLPAPRHRTGPVLILKLFVTESYEQRQIGPCVVSADQRVYVEISAKEPVTHFVEVMSCVVSPWSDPNKAPFWTVIKDGCSSDPSLTLSTVMEGDEEGTSDDEDGELEEEKDTKVARGEDRGYSDFEGKGGGVSLRGKMGRRGRKAHVRRKERSTGTEAEEEIHSLRFSFILRPLFNDSVQFLHCCLRLCVSNSTRGGTLKETAEEDCDDGLRLPPLVSKLHRQKCETRNLTRPMVVTQPFSSLAPKPLRPPTGQRTKRLSVSPLTNPEPEHSSPEFHTGLVMGIVFAAFVMGVCLMGALWGIFYYTGIRSQSLGGAAGHLAEPSYNIWTPVSVAEQTSCL